MVLDQKGKKMSKSLGNVTSPMTVVDGGLVRFLAFHLPPCFIGLLRI
jgi:valyl-tRNA synthetase